MAVTLQVTRGYTAVEGVPITTADFNALGLPTVIMDGDVIEEGGVLPSDCVAGAYFAAASTGTFGAYAVTLTPAPSSYTNGMWLSFVANHANSTIATLDVNTIGAIPIVSQSGQALTGGEIVVGQPVWVQYYATGNHWRMLSVPTKARTYAVDSGAANAYAIAVPGWATGTITLANMVGVPIWWQVTNVNTAASTLAVNGTAATAIRAADGRPMWAGELPASGIVCTVYDGTYHRLVAGGVVTPTAAVTGTTLDWAAAETQYRVLAANLTYTAFSNADEGRVCSIMIQQAASGGPYTVSWDAGLAIKWVGASAPSMATTASRCQLYSFKKVNGIVLGFVSPNHG